MAALVKATGTFTRDLMAITREPGTMNDLINSNPLIMIGLAWAGRLMLIGLAIVGIRRISKAIYYGLGCDLVDKNGRIKNK